MLPQKSRWSVHRKSRRRSGSGRNSLSKLRELALVLAADVVDCQLNAYLEQHGIQQHFGAHERILVCITPRANLEEMLEEGRIVAERFHGELIVAYVRQPNISPEDQAALDSKLDLASSVGARVEILEGRRSRGGTSGICQVSRSDSVVCRPQPAQWFGALSGQPARQVDLGGPRHGCPRVPSIDDGRTAAWKTEDLHGVCRRCRQDFQDAGRSTGHGGQPASTS